MEIGTLKQAKRVILAEWRCEFRVGSLANGTIYGTDRGRLQSLRVAVLAPDMLGIIVEWEKGQCDQLTYGGHFLVEWQPAPEPARYAPTRNYGDFVNATQARLIAWYDYGFHSPTGVIERAVRAGEIEGAHKTVGNYYRIPRANLESWFKAQIARGRFKVKRSVAT